VKTAIIYDRVNKWGGAERVLLALHEIFPEAILYTSVYNPESAPWAKVFPEVRTSFLQKVKTFRNKHELLAPLMPLAFESFDFSEFDLVISVTSESGKGIITKPNTKHICYCLTPTRYLWSGYESYFPTLINKTISKPVVSYLRNWDKVASKRPDKYLAISSEVQKRIKKYYEKDSVIVFPPNKNNLKTKEIKLPFDNFYLIVSRLVSYKKVDLAINTFNELDKNLIVVGVGTEKEKLVKMAKGNIYFCGFAKEEELNYLYKKAKAFIMPQYEDFGLVSVEAQSMGTPVIAFKKGGSLDTIVDTKSGIFFEEQTRVSLTHAIDRFEKMQFDSNYIVKNANKFAFDIFKKRILSEIQ